MSDKIRLVFRPRVDQLRIVAINMPEILAMIENIIALDLTNPKCGRCGKPAYVKGDLVYAKCLNCLNDDIDFLLHGDLDEYE